jgi:hypothetical protein
MAPPFATIERDFQRLRGFVLNDLDRIVGAETGGNFAAVALVLVACEALGQLRYGGQRPEVRAFSDCLPDEWQPVARTLYDALRNGLVHNYDAMNIWIDGEAIGFEFAWRGERHLTFGPDPRTRRREGSTTASESFVWSLPGSSGIRGRNASAARNRTHLCLVVPDLVAGLHQAFDDYESELRADPNARDAFFTRLRRIRDQRVEAAPKEIPAWRSLLARER